LDWRVGSFLAIKIAFGQLQAERNGADCDTSWPVAANEVKSAIRTAELVFSTCGAVRTQEPIRNYLLSIFGANR
jgi:hypothetical protein